jgi:hypothetical protein
MLRSKKYSLLVVSLFVFLCVISLTSASAAPNILNYQGTLLGADKKPVTGVKTMSFKIYGAVTGGTALWSSPVMQVNVVNGFFSVTLEGVPVDLFKNDTLYIATIVEGVELTDRKRLASVPYSLNASSAESGIPKGVIVMWSGSKDQIPAGWALCDGQNGTPDLRDKFILGGGGSMPITGGTQNHSHTVSNHQHGINASDLNHYHGVQGHTHNFAGDTSIENKPQESISHGSYGAAEGQHFHTFSGTTDSGTAHNTNNSSEAGFNLNHNHGGTTQSGGSGSTGTGSNIPPYYSLCFIMKL